MFLLVVIVIYLHAINHNIKVKKQFVRQNKDCIFNYYLTIKTKVMSKKKQKQETMTVETVVIENVTEATVTTTKRRGRPVVESSVRQLKLAAQAARGEVKRGRPTNPNSNRQTKIAARMIVIANGGEVKRGRPKMIKEEVVA